MIYLEIIHNWSAKVKSVRKRRGGRDDGATRLPEARPRPEVSHMERIDPESFPAGIVCRSKIQSAVVESRRIIASELSGENRGPLSSSFLTSSVPLLESDRRERASRKAVSRRGGQKRVRDSNSVVLSLRIMACPFARLPMCRRGGTTCLAKTIIDRLTFRASPRSGSSSRHPCDAARRISRMGSSPPPPPLPHPARPFDRRGVRGMIFSHLR